MERLTPRDQIVIYNLSNHLAEKLDVPVYDIRQVITKYAIEHLDEFRIIFNCSVPVPDSSDSDDDDDSSDDPENETQDTSIPYIDSSSDSDDDDPHSNNYASLHS